MNPSQYRYASPEPTLHEGVYVFVSLPNGSGSAELYAVATMQEHEGMTAVLPEEEARKRGLQILFRAAWITLNVHSDLSAIGLTAAVATALTRVDISCNVIAGAHHDHIFVPIARGRGVTYHSADLGKTGRMKIPNERGREKCFVIDG